VAILVVRGWFSEDRRAIEDHAIPTWETWWLGEIEPGDARELFGAMRGADESTSQIKKTKAALSALFATPEIGVLLAEINQREQVAFGDGLPGDTKPPDWPASSNS
jgi:hypothetical protein